MFPDDKAAAEQWFEDQRWPNGERFCPDCGSVRYSIVTSHRMPYRCKECRNYISVRKGTFMQDSKLGLRKWAFALYHIRNADTDSTPIDRVGAHWDARCDMPDHSPVWQPLSTESPLKSPTFR